MSELASLDVYKFEFEWPLVNRGIETKANIFTRRRPFRSLPRSIESLSIRNRTNRSNFSFSFLISTRESHVRRNVEY